LLLLPACGEKEKKSSIGLRRAHLGDRLLEILKLLTALWAELLQVRDLLAGFGDISGLDEELAEIFQRPLVVGIEFERLSVEGESPLGIAALAKAEAQEVIDVGVLDAPVDQAV